LPSCDHIMNKQLNYRNAAGCKQAGELQAWLLILRAKHFREMQDSDGENTKTPRNYEKYT
jgi:hypothetical protein